jgi:hypothetical protein
MFVRRIPYLDDLLMFFCVMFPAGFSSFFGYLDLFFVGQCVRPGFPAFLAAFLAKQGHNPADFLIRGLLWRFLLGLAGRQVANDLG